VYTAKQLERLPNLGSKLLNLPVQQERNQTNKTKDPLVGCMCTAINRKSSAGWRCFF